MALSHTSLSPKIVALPVDKSPGLVLKPTGSAKGLSGQRCPIYSSKTHLGQKP